MAKQSLDNFLAIYKNPDFHPTFLANNEAYDRNNSDNYPNFLSPAGDVLPEMCEKLAFHCQQKTKHFICLKKLAKELIQNLDRSAALMNEISLAIARNAELTSKMDAKSNSHFHAIEIEQELDISRQFNSWGLSLYAQKEFVSDQLLGYFQYSKHERRELSNLFSVPLEMLKKSMSNMDTLTKKKRKIFDNSKAPEWVELKKNQPEEFEVISKDFAKAGDFFLVEETQKLKTENNIARYLCKQVLYEYYNYILNKKYYHLSNFGTLAWRLKELYDNRLFFWNEEFEKKPALVEWDHFGVVPLKFEIAIKN